MQDKQIRNWVVFCHLGGLLCVSFLNIAIPLVIWLTKKKDAKFIEEQGKEIVNFQISYSIYTILLLVMGFTIIGLVVTVPGIFILVIISIISIIRGAIRASNGEDFRYPINLRLLK